MPGAIAIVIVLFLFPVIALTGAAVLAAILAMVLNRDAEVRNEDSELLELNI